MRKGPACLHRASPSSSLDARAAPRLAQAVIPPSTDKVVPVT